MCSPVGKEYVVIGFPVTQTKLDSNKKTVTVSSCAYRLSSFEDAAYPKLGLDADTHIALKFDQRNGTDLFGTNRNFPKPQGMSGSPIFVLYDESSSFKTLRTFPLVGVATTHKRGDKLIFGTDISYVTKAIEQLAGG